MTSRRVNPYLIKRNRSYTASELAARLGVHKNTVRNWQRDGLAPLDDGRPALFHGGTAFDYLVKRNARRKRPCPPGTIYCFRCREARQPAFGTAEYLARTPETGNLRALCQTCGTTMHRRVRRSAIADVLPGTRVAIREDRQRLVNGSSPSLNCDIEEES